MINKNRFFLFSCLIFIFTISIPSCTSENKTEQPKTLSTQANNKATIFQRIPEKTENAFSLLVPEGWQIDGGIMRVNPITQGGAAQSIAAKVDFAVKSDNQGSVAIRWLPDVLFFDARWSPAGQMGLYPPGSNYNGMSVYPIMPATQFLQQIAFPYAHPQATNVRIIEQKSLPQTAQKFQQRVLSTMPQMTFSYDAGLITIEYQENGISYREKMIGIIENWGQLGAGMWGNKETYLIRTPVNEFDKWQSTLSIIQNSVQINSKWLAGEIRGQQQRGEIMINTMQEMQRIEKAIGEHRQKTNSEIHNDMFLTLTDQEEYVNPFTKEVEYGSNQWQYRWTNPNGDVIYTDSEDYDPRTDVHLNRTDYKRTPIRKRFPNE
jgi:hypothetical protein